MFLRKDFLTKERCSLESKEVAELEDQKRLLHAQLDSALQCIVEISSTAEVHEQKYLRVRLERKLLRIEVNCLERVIVVLELCKVCL